MDEKKSIEVLDSMETKLIDEDGWELNKIFVEDISKRDKNYNNALDYARGLTTKFKVAMRSVIRNKYFFVDVYKKKEE